MGGLVALVAARVAVPDCGAGGCPVGPDASATFGCVFLGQHAEQGDFNEVSVTKETRAIRKESSHCFHGQVDRGRRAGAHGFQVVILQDVEDLDDSGPSGTGRRSAKDLKITVRAVDGFSFDSGVLPKVAVGNRSAVRQHVRRNQTGGLPGIKLVRAIVRDPIKCRCQVGLAQDLSNFEWP